VPLGNNVFPLQVHAPYAVLVLPYGATVGLLSMTVSYVIRRRSVTYPATFTTTTDIDLFVVGPANPNDPDQTNPNLNAPIVRGEDANGTEGNDNEVIPDHANRRANVYIVLWSVAPTPDARPFTLYLFYEGVQVGQLFVPGGLANQVVTLQIPWSVISEHGNGLKRVHYAIGAEQYQPTIFARHVGDRDGQYHQPRPAGRAQSDRQWNYQLHKLQACRAATGKYRGLHPSVGAFHRGDDRDGSLERLPG
jgi:hypothetical protein